MAFKHWKGTTLKLLAVCRFVMRPCISILFYILLLLLVVGAFSTPSAWAQDEPLPAEPSLSDFGAVSQLRSMTLWLDSPALTLADYMAVWRHFGDRVWMQLLLSEQEAILNSVGDRLAMTSLDERETLTFEGDPFVLLRQFDAVVADAVQVLLNTFQRDPTSIIGRESLELVNSWVHVGIADSFMPLPLSAPLLREGLQADLQLIAMLPHNTARSAAVMRLWYFDLGQRTLFAEDAMTTGTPRGMRSRREASESLALLATTIGNYESDSASAEAALDAFYWQLRTDLAELNLSVDADNMQALASRSVATAWQWLLLRDLFSLIVKLANPQTLDVTLHVRAAALRIICLLETTVMQTPDADFHALLRAFDQLPVPGSDGSTLFVSAAQVYQEVGELFVAIDEAQLIDRYLQQDGQKRPVLVDTGVMLARHWLSLESATVEGSERAYRPGFGLGRRLLARVMSLNQGRHFPAIYQRYPEDYSRVHEDVVALLWHGLSIDPRAVQPLARVIRLALRNGHLTSHRWSAETATIVRSLLDGDVPRAIDTAQLELLQTLLRGAVSEALLETASYPLFAHVAHYPYEPQLAESALAIMLDAEAPSVAGHLQRLERMGILRAWQAALEAPRRITEGVEAKRSLVGAAIALATGVEERAAAVEAARAVEVQPVGAQTFGDALTLLAIYRQRRSEEVVTEATKAWMVQMDGFLADLFETEAGRSVLSEWSSEPLALDGPLQARLAAAKQGRQVLGGMSMNDVASLFANGLARGLPSVSDTSITTLEKAIVDASTHLRLPESSRSPRLIELTRALARSSY